MESRLTRIAFRHIRARRVRGAGIKVVHGGIKAAMSEEEDYSIGALTTDVIRGGLVGMLSAAFIGGHKNLGRMKEFYETPELLWTASAKGAAKWTMVSPAFTVGGGLWKNLFTKMQFFIDGEHSIQGQNIYGKEIKTWDDLPWIGLL